jgi:hypothetical protein
MLRVSSGMGNFLEGATMAQVSHHLSFSVGRFQFVQFFMDNPSTHHERSSGTAQVHQFHAVTRPSIRIVRGSLGCRSCCRSRYARCRDGGFISIPSIGAKLKRNAQAMHTLKKAEIGQARTAAKAAAM